jgi:hypothetical protein
MLGSEPHELIKLRSANSREALARLGIGQPEPLVGRIIVPAVASTISGTVRYLAPEGGAYPVRRALVQIVDAAGTVLAVTGTNDAGAYSAAIDAASIQVKVYTQDVDNTRVAVFPPGQPTLRYLLQSAVLPVTAAAMTVDITSAPTVRGAPGAPSTDSLNARAFAAYDAMFTFWTQASGLLGRSMQRAATNFPAGGSFYQRSTQQMSILREDAFDWDVLGHEFFHFTTDRGAARVIDTSLGGAHDGGSAIGQDDGTGHLRTRDEGMRLAWSEGLATAMSLLIQRTPPVPFAFPAILNVGDAAYQDTEDAALVTNAETPNRNEGFGSENSVLGVFWDLYDPAQDGTPTAVDGLAVLNASLAWQIINSILPCNPCDRADRFWRSIPLTFGITNPLVLEVAKLFALNNMAPRATAPADNSSSGGTSAPTFQWSRNGDLGPVTAGHRNNQFFLVFSRDNFQSHLILIPVPTLDATSYQPTDAEWASVQAGGAPGQPYKWFVAAQRADAPVIPEGWFWYSNAMTVIPRSLEAIIQWVPLGADVDLHLANPTGVDIAYYNRTTSWGFLDRDCISTCTQEIISVTSLPFSGTYRLYVHYYSDHGYGPATVRARVRAGSAILLDTTFVLTGTGAIHNLVTVNVGDEGMTAVPGADAVVMNPMLLPPKKQ